MLGRLLRKKPITHHSHHSDLHRTLTAFDLTLMGIGAIIGAGVFVLTGVAAATKAGPAVMLSFVLAGIASMFAALAYAELAASVGGTGSAYSYAFAGFGELVAWIIGWNLILEYAMSVATVAIGWSGYVSNFFESIGLPMPHAITANPFQGGDINLPAFLIIFAIGALLCVGIRQSAKFNNIIVAIKLSTIVFFIVIASMNINPANWHPFMPFGPMGVVQGAALVFFAYIGFDALSTAVEEAIEPQHSIPIGIIFSLIGCTIIYIIVSGLLTGIAPYQDLNVGSPVAKALLDIGYRSSAGIIAVGAIAGLTTVMLIMFYGLTRIILAMARDHLIPNSLATIHPTTKTPIRTIFVCGIIIALVAGFSPIDKAAELVNIGTLAAFVFVCLGIVVLRITHPDLERPFRLPFNPLIPLLGTGSCIYLMLNLSEVTWMRFVIWSIVGIALYFGYGYRHSIYRQKQH
ncbi:MAG TPA: amino acid permease [Gammaproteobacteria bacterium]|jgi:APA family basic amino acid/polyamine antiporter|nr:amino acid permease [Gammaproteobacteria bacterium]